LLLGIACSKKKDVNTTSNIRNRPNVVKKRTTETIEDRLLRKIKERTKRDLKLLGIRKVLLSDGGLWDEAIQFGYEFKNNGRVYLSDKGQKKGYCFWKVINNILYIHPNNNDFILRGEPRNQSNSRYIPVLVKPTDSFAHTSGHISHFKYALIIKSAGGEIYMNIAHATRNKVVN
jgi:hypothetical protein